MVCSIIRTGLGKETDVKVIIDLEQGAELFQNIGRMIRLRKQQALTMNELALSVIHYKAILPDDADLEGTPSIIILDEKGLKVLRRAFKLAINPMYRKSLTKHSDLGKKYKSKQLLGALASQITTDDAWESFTVPILISGEERKITLSTQHAKFMIQYLVPRMFGGDYPAVWYGSGKLQPWEEDA